MSNKALLVVDKNTNKGNISTIVDDIVKGMKVAPLTYYDYKDHFSVTKIIYVLTLEDGDEFKVKAIDKVFTADCGPELVDDAIKPELVFKLESSGSDKTVEYDSEELITIPDDEFKEVFDMYMKYTKNDGDLNINKTYINHNHDRTILYVPGYSNFSMFKLKTGFKEVSIVTDRDLEEIYDIYFNVMEGKDPYNKLVDIFSSNMYFMSAYGVESHSPIYNTILMQYSGRQDDRLNMSTFKLTENVDMSTYRNIHREPNNNAFTINVDDNHMIMLF